MHCFEDRRGLDNLLILRATHFFRIVDPEREKNFKPNVYLMTSVLFLVVTVCMIVLGLVGVVHNGDLYMTTDYVSVFVVLSTVSYSFITVSKVLTIVLNAKDIWNLIVATDISRVRNGPGSKYVALYDRYSDSTAFLSKAILGCSATGLCLWCFYPLLINANANATETQRYENIFNFPYYRIAPSDYNKYFYAFYTLEVSVLVFCVYSMTVFNTLFIYFANVLTAQYEINSLTFEDIGHDGPSENGKSFTKNVGTYIFLVP